MASATDAIAEAETTKSKKRVSDCLGDSDGADEVEAAPSPPSPETPPRLRLPMFTCARLRFVRLGRKGGGGGRKEVAAEKSEAASVDSSGWKAGSGSGGASTEAGMGLSLLFLLAKTCVELNRMADVRAQMEALLEEMRHQVVTTKRQSTDHVAVPRTFDLLQPSSSSPCRASDTDTNGRATCSSSAMEMASSESEGPAMRIDVPGQFHLNCNGAEQETSESSEDEFIELEGGFGGGGDPRPGSEDGEEEHDDGVSALKLERRLHELLHRRNRERIEELEASLQRAEKKLMEKEMEARMWKDTARLALQ